MRIEIENIIYWYLFLCVALLLFHLAYVLFSGLRGYRSQRLTERWAAEIGRQLSLLREGFPVEPAHQRRLRRTLRHVEQLISYAEALSCWRGQEPGLVRDYLFANCPAMQELAFAYQGRESMERAYFAYFISKNQPCAGEEYHPLMGALLSYLENSTVYCRHLVLEALCALGNVQAVEKLLASFNENAFFHHHKLLSDALLSFSGDREALAARLWGHCGQWNVNLMTAVIEFISGCSDAYQKPFCALIVSGQAEAELRLAALRYFRRRPYAPMRPILLQLLKSGGSDVNLAIVAASVLDRYPGQDTVAALKAALSHPNWYVRYNAAGSLVALGQTEASLKDILEGPDRFAREILAYRLGEAAAAKEAKQTA